MNETRHTTVDELALHRFRVTDMASHGVEFEASSMASFVHEAANALDTFHHDKGLTKERWLALHAWDGEWWVDVRLKITRRVVQIKKDMLWREAAFLWESAKNTSNSANHMVKHTSGLTQFLPSPPDVSASHLPLCDNRLAYPLPACIT